MNDYKKYREYGRVWDEQISHIERLVNVVVEGGLALGVCENIIFG